MRSVILSVAGSDSSSGAGIQADLKTAAALGVYCCTAVTAVTAQNHRSVTHIHPVARESIREQLDALATGFPITAIKIGMLASADVIEEVVSFLKRFENIPVIVDTVLKATVGHELLPQNALSLYIEELLPKATLITPNIFEAATLIDVEHAVSEEGLQWQAKELLKTGAKAVLLKGGHLPGEHAIDCLAMKDTLKCFSSKKIDAQNTHGTGCTLSTAIAAYLVRGENLLSSIELAKHYVERAIHGSREWELAESNGPLHHFWQFAE